MSNSLQILKLAVCLFPDVALLDFQGCVEQFGFLSPENVLDTESRNNIPSKVAIEIEYLAPTAGLTKPWSGPALLPTRSYDSVKDGEQFDIVLVPGGAGVLPEVLPPSVISFLQKQAPGVKYMLSVCTGSWVLARAGLLRGKRATTIKFMFNQIKDATKDFGVDWVVKARWVVDGNYWTSSGLTSGIDMGHAFVLHLAGEEAAKKIRGINEINVRGEGDDEYAAFYGLV